jgi:hypothetical protein
MWRARKANWLALSRPLFSMFFWTIFRMAFSNSFPDVDGRIIGRKFWGDFGSLHGFGNVMTFVSSPRFWKWDSRRQWLNKCVKFTSGRLGRCLRHSFGKSSIPKNFLNFKELIYFRKSHGLILSGGVLSTASSRVWTSSLHPPLMVFVTQILACELILQAVSNYVGFLGLTKFKAWSTMNGCWCPWSISL